MITLVSVNVAQPEVIGARRGRPVLSGIRKRPIHSETVAVTEINIAGDDQADRRVHGGPDKAIYVYSDDHYPWWTGELRPDEPYGPGAFGENLTVAGIDETGVCLGDTWRWGTVLLQICQPRYPCFKLAMTTDQPDIIKRFLESGRSGWYLRVLEPGAGIVAGPIELVDKDPAGITVREAALATNRQGEPERLLEIAAHPALAPGWATMLRHIAIAPA